MKEYFVNTAFLKEGQNVIRATVLFDNNNYKGEGLFNGAYSTINYINTNVLAYYEPDEEKLNLVQVLIEPWHFDKIQVTNIIDKEKIVANSDDEAIQQFIRQSGRKVARNKISKSNHAINALDEVTINTGRKTPEKILLRNDNPTDTEKLLFKYCQLYRISSKDKYVRYAPVRLEEGYDNYPETLEIKQEMIELTNDVIFHKDTQNVTIYNNNFDLMGVSLLMDRCMELGFKL